MAEISTLLNGYKRFYQKQYQPQQAHYKELVDKGQFPKTMIISCADSRVDPTLIFDANPGDIFTIRNVANLVPPYQPGTKSLHGVSAALEFAVNFVNIEHIVVMGHTHCAGIRALLEGSTKEHSEFIHNWVSIGEEARDTTHKAGPFDEELHALEHCGFEAIKLSLRNLESFPFIKAKMDAGALSIHGWHFRLENGNLNVLDRETGEFEAVEIAS